MSTATTRRSTRSNVTLSASDKEKVEGSDELLDGEPMLSPSTLQDDCSSNEKKLIDEPMDDADDVESSKKRKQVNDEPTDADPLTELTKKSKLTVDDEANGGTAASESNGEFVVMDEATASQGEEEEGEDVQEGGQSKQEQEAVVNQPVAPEFPELDRLWESIKSKESKNEHDTTSAEEFQAWTYLLQYVDSGSLLESGTSDRALEEGRKAYDEFLYKFPYCYGYWKKFADFEKKYGTQSKCMLVFERGIKAIPLSADLWIHYLSYVKNVYDDNPEFIRAQYERAVKACGREWRSDKLWDNFVKWENTETQNKINVFKLYDRIIRNATLGVAQQFEIFRDFINEHSPKDFLPTDIFVEVRRELFAKRKAIESDESSDKTSESNVEEEKAESKDGSDENTETVTTSDKELSNRDNITEEESQAIREKIIFSRKKIFKEVQDKVQVRAKYEEQIRRPYFHMKPLERSQLKNWNEYLDHEMNKFNKEFVVDKKCCMDELINALLESDVHILFERCLIACALYQEFWIKYCNFLISILMTDEIADSGKGGKPSKKEVELLEIIEGVYERAVKYHLPQKFDIRLHHAKFAERCKRWEDAETEYEKIFSEIKNSTHNVFLIMEHIQFRRRRVINESGAVVGESIKELYQSRLDGIKSEDGEGNVGAKCDLAIKYARFLRYQMQPDADGTNQSGESEDSKVLRSSIDQFLKSIESTSIPSKGARGDALRKRNMSRLQNMYLQLVDSILFSIRPKSNSSENRVVTSILKILDEASQQCVKLASTYKYNDELISKLQLSFVRRKLEFMQDFSSNLNEIVKTQGELKDLEDELDRSVSAVYAENGTTADQSARSTQQHHATVNGGAGSGYYNSSSPHTNMTRQQPGSHYATATSNSPGGRYGSSYPSQSPSTQSKSSYASSAYTSQHQHYGSGGLSAQQTYHYQSQPQHYTGY